MIGLAPVRQRELADTLGFIADDSDNPDPIKAMEDRPGKREIAAVVQLYTS